MKKATAVLILAFALLSACSDSGPQVARTTSTDQTPVAGQRIMLNIYAITDDYRGYYPMLYDWSCSGGELIHVDHTFWYTYWTAPDTAGSYSVTCTIKDNSNSNRFTWNFAVAPRTLAELSVSGTTFTDILAKDPSSLIGGIYAGTTTNKVWYYSATEAYQTGLSLAADQALIAMTAWKISAYGYSYDSIYAASKSTTATPTTYSITALSGGRNISIPRADAKREIKAIEVVGDYLLIGTTTGLEVIDLSSGVATDASASFTGIPGTATITSFVLNDNYVYASTTSGVYLLDRQADTHAFTLITTPSTLNPKSIAVRKITETQYELWAVVANGGGTDVINYYTINLTSSRTISSVTETVTGANADGPSLTVDLRNQVWNGRQYFDVNHTKHSAADLSSIPTNPTTNIRSLVSPEGLLYIRDDAGKLWVWGKKYSG